MAKIEELDTRIAQLQKDRHSLKWHLEAEQMDVDVAFLTRAVHRDAPIIVFSGDARAIPVVVGLEAAYDRFDVPVVVHQIEGKAASEMFYNFRNEDDIDASMVPSAFRFAAFSEDIVDTLRDTTLDKTAFATVLRRNTRVINMELVQAPAREEIVATVALDIFFKKTLMARSVFVKAVPLPQKEVTQLCCLSPEWVFAHFQGVALVDVAKGRMLFETTLHDTELWLFAGVDESRVVVCDTLTGALQVIALAPMGMVLQPVFQLKKTPNASALLVLPRGWVTTCEEGSLASLQALRTTHVFMEGEEEDYGTEVITWIPTRERRSPLSVFVTPEGAPRVLFMRAVDRVWCTVDPFCGATTAEDVAANVHPLPPSMNSRARTPLLASRHSPFVVAFDVTGKIAVFDGIGGRRLRKIKTLPFTAISPPFGATCVLACKNTLVQVDLIRGL